MGAVAVAATLALLAPPSHAIGAPCDDPSETECLILRLEAHSCARMITEHTFVMTASKMAMTPQQFLSLSIRDPDKLTTMLRERIIEASEYFATILEGMLLVDDGEQEEALIKICVETLGDSPLD